jgi:hypothetical protein
MYIVKVKSDEFQAKDWEFLMENNEKMIFGRYRKDFLRLMVILRALKCLMGF